MLGDNPFELWGAPHLTAMGLILLTPILLTVIARRCSHKVVKGICLVFAAILLANELSYWVYAVLNLDIESILRSYLPLHVCGIAVYALMVALVFRNQLAYEVAFFWGLAGTANAVLTPQLEVGFPELRFFQYFINHGGIVAGALFATWGLKMRPTFASLLRAYGLACVLLVVLLILNPILGSNYMFLRAPPVSASPFFFAPWPYYIPILAAVALVLFCALLAPFKVADWIRHHRRS